MGLHRLRHVIGVSPRPSSRNEGALRDEVKHGYSFSSFCIV